MDRGLKRGAEETDSNANAKKLEVCKNHEPENEVYTVKHMKKDVVSLLMKEEGNGKLVVGGLVEEVPSVPLLWVKRFGRVALPLTSASAAALQAAMERAPYGLGEASLLDTKVVDSWQLGPDRFRLDSRTFVEKVEGELMQRVKVELGLGKQVEVRAELSKLLLYKAGGNYKAQQDMCKKEGMFGTLILQLPSEFTGGELVVRHGVEELVVAMAREGAATSCVFAAHFSGCEHELREVTSGHRLALVYSLCWQGGDTAASAGKVLGSRDTLAKAVARLTQVETRLCWALKHMYTDESMKKLGISALKGKDRNVVNMLVEASRKLQGEEGVEINPLIKKQG